MSIKGLFFCLLLYVSLVWVGGALLYQGPNSWAKIRNFGLLWTVVGLSTVLGFIVVARIVGWARLLHAKAKTRSAVPERKTAAPPVHEDDAALAALIAEANSVLAKSPPHSAHRNPLNALPVYLLIGPEGSGKTSTFLHSGLNAQLIAGQLGTSGPLISTRLANIWVVNNIAFIEIAGRVFSGDASRWTRLLAVLRGTPAKPAWRSFWREPEPALSISGVVAFCDAKNFTGSVNLDRLTRDGRLWQERLGAIGEVFGVEYPVYQVITRCDSISFFEEYFRRLPDGEANQALGCTLAAEDPVARTGEVFADSEGKRLSRSFTALFNALADRRLMHMAHEPDRRRRPAIYEFPREFKRMRPALVQFLTDAFRPHPLRPGPVLRGYYMTAVREVEAAPADPGATRADWSSSDLAGDASRLLRADATQMFRPGDLTARNGAMAPTARQWMFTSDLFRNIVLLDRPARRVVSIDPRAGRRRRAVAAVACAVCALLTFAWIWSWAANRRLLMEVQAASQGRKSVGAASLSELRALDHLRGQVARLVDYDRDGAPLSLRWGLYSGGDLAPAARAAYFRRFQQLILNDLNAVIVANLQAAPPAPAPGAAYDAVYRPLAAHMMISSAACRPDPALVAAVLKQNSDQNTPAAGAEAKDLVARQIDFYAKELRYGNPCRISENTAARDRARQYLARVNGVDRIYAGILARAEKSLTSTQRLRDLAPDYSLVMSGQAEMSGVFLHDGWAFVEDASKQTQNADAGDACVVGSGGTRGESKPDADVQRAIQVLYSRDYIERWRKFVTSFSVIRYASPEDAAKKLDILAGHRSPLLAVLLMTSNETALAASPSQPAGLLDPFVNKVARLTTGGSAADKDTKTVDTFEAAGTPAIIARTFQPVHVVVPARSATWVNDRNSAYIDALAQLSHSMIEISRANTDPAVQQGAGQNYDKALDTVRQIARAFKPVGVEGLDGSVQNLLEQPIRLTQRFISRDVEKTLAAAINGELKALCTRMRGTLDKYPFNAAGDDASLQDVEALFSPANGAIWKFEAQSLADLVIKEGSQWKAKDPAKKPQVTPEMLAFLNAAQQIAEVFYPGGAPRAQLIYVLRPKLDPALKNWVLELQLDGVLRRWDQTLQKQFTWPAPPGSKTLEAVVRLRQGDVAFPVASEGGLWAIFRIMADAAPRAVGSRLVEWKMLRGARGRLEPIQPGPVQLEIVEFPGGADIFNPRFFEKLQCPGKAVQ